MTADKRKLKRRHLIYYLRVMERGSGDLVGFLVDITTEGIMIMSEKPIAAGTTLQVRMLLQSDMSMREQLEFDMRCKWCRPSINDISYDVGFELLNVQREDLKEIEQVIEDLGFND